MSNRDTRVARHYHSGTKHPGGRLLDPNHVYDWSRRPLLYKIYEDVESIPLPLDKTALGTPALEAIARSEPAADGEEDGARVPDFETLARLLYFSAGITKRIDYGGRIGEMAFRAASCTGALYHIELYVVCGDLEGGLDAGVYHYDPRENALTPLRRGDYRRHLVEATGEEPAVAQAPLHLVYTDYFWRNAVKYQARAYRHTFWDGGTILSHTLAVAAAHDLPARVVTGFVDQTVNDLLSLDTEREAALALIPIGTAPEEVPEPPPPLEPLDMETTPIADREGRTPVILEMHTGSSLEEPEEVAGWRDEPPAQPLPDPDGRLFSLEPLAGDVPDDALEPVIIRRGSSRRFHREPITFGQLSTILQQALHAVPADFGSPPDLSLNHVYLIANAVDGLPAGSYVYHHDRQALELLQEGEFRGEAGHLALGQALAADASVNVYFLSDLAPVLERFGNRGYRAAQLEGGIAGGRVYLASYALGLGATGLTFFDDGVTSFFSPHAEGKSVMFLVAVGRPAKRSG